MMQAPDPEFDLRYDKYVKPLEPERWGEFVAVDPDGQMFFGSNSHDVVVGSKGFGRMTYIYKVGPRAIGRGSTRWWLKSIDSRDPTEP